MVGESTLSGPSRDGVPIRAVHEHVDVEVAMGLLKMRRPLGVEGVDLESSS